MLPGDTLRDGDLSLVLIARQYLWRIILQLVLAKRPAETPIKTHKYPTENSRKTLIANAHPLPATKENLNINTLLFLVTTRHFGALATAIPFKSSAGNVTDIKSLFPVKMGKRKRERDKFDLYNLNF